MSLNDAKDFATKQFCRATYADGRATESLYGATKTFSHMIKQLLHQYHKILDLCNIKGALARPFSLNIARKPIFCGIDAITDNYTPGGQSLETDFSIKQFNYMLCAYVV